jgi:hypothetical protein
MEEDAVLTNPARYNEVTQEMARRWKLSTAVAGLVATAWVAAAILPIDILTMDHSESLGSKLQVIGAPGAVIALSVYLGLRARRKGRRLAFYLRAVVTIVLLWTSTPFVLATR